MPRAELVVRPPADTWIHELSTAHPEAAFTVVAVLPGTDTGVALLEVEGVDPVAVVAAAERHGDVVGLDLLWTQGETALLQVETSDARLLEPVLAAGVPLRTPFAVRDGEATWTLTTSRDRLSDLGDRLDAAGIDYDIRSVREATDGPEEGLMTDRQRELLLAAAGLGYYDTPRRVTLTGVAEAVGVSKATASDVLHRAEGAVVTWFVETHLS